MLSVIPMVIVFGILGFCYNSWLHFVALPVLFGGYPISGLLLLLIWHVLCLLCVWSYVKANLTDPGTVSRIWSDSVAELERSESLAKFTADQSEGRRSMEGNGNVSGHHVTNPEGRTSGMSSRDPEGESTPLTGGASSHGANEVKRDGTRRFCRKCDKFKPDRAHHCSLCGKCVLKMDHHCPWIGNCVGWGNYKFFYLFCFWGTILAYFGSAGFLYRLLVAPLVTSDDVHSLPPPFSFIMATVMAGVFAIALTGFVVMHFQLIVTNSTTIEAMEKRAKFRNNRVRGLKNPYNRGSWAANWREVMGTVPWLYFIPTASTVVGDGLRFQAFDANGARVW